MREEEQDAEQNMERPGERLVGERKRGGAEMEVMEDRKGEERREGR